MQHYYIIARAKTQLKNEKAIRCDKKITSKQPEYKIGDKVYLKESQIKSKDQNLFNGS